MSGEEFGQIYDLNASTMALTRTIPLHRDRGRDGSSSGRGVPNYVGGIAISPDGQYAHFTAVKSNTQRGTYFDLGPGTTGTAVPCGDSVFFVRDPQGPDEPARLMRWTPGRTLEVAYESPSTGNAFLGEPVCGGGVLTLASYGEEGDEHVCASVS